MVCSCSQEWGSKAPSGTLVKSGWYIVGAKLRCWEWGEWKTQKPQDVFKKLLDYWKHAVKGYRERWLGAGNPGQVQERWLIQDQLPSAVFEHISLRDCPRAASTAHAVEMEAICSKQAPSFPDHSQQARPSSEFLRVLEEELSSRVPGPCHHFTCGSSLTHCTWIDLLCRVWFEKKVEYTFQSSGAHDSLSSLAYKLLNSCPPHLVYLLFS